MLFGNKFVDGASNHQEIPKSTTRDDGWLQRGLMQAKRDVLLQPAHIKYKPRNRHMKPQE